MLHLRSIFRRNTNHKHYVRFLIFTSFHPNNITPQPSPYFSHLHSLPSPPISSLTGPEIPQRDEENLEIQVNNVLEKYRDAATRVIELALDLHCPTLTEDLVLNVLKRRRSDWRPAHVFFNWVSKCRRIAIGSSVYNEILDVLGRMGRFEELRQVFDEMCERGGLLNEETYTVLVNRYAAAHMVEEAVEVFKRRRELGLVADLVGFQKLLMCLCRYKHVEVAETLLRANEEAFGVDIKTMNIVLNGWCVLNNVCEVKRFWKDIMASRCRPDLFTYGTFIKALTKKGRLGTAMKLYRGMWERGCYPDVVICNCVIDALCFKKRVPEALEVFSDMNKRGCLRNVATYNSLIKHLCKLRRMETVYKLLDDMEADGGSCTPNVVTFNHLLNSLKKPEDVPAVLERMKRNGCEMSSDMYNLQLRLYASWNREDMVRSTWDEMEKNRFGPDRRSYTVMIHWLLDKERVDEASSFFKEMKIKGMVPEPRTEILVKEIKKKMKESKKRGKVAETSNVKSTKNVKHGDNTKPIRECCCSNSEVVSVASF